MSEELREAMAQVIAARLGWHGVVVRTGPAHDLADALLSGPLAPLLAAQVERVGALHVPTHGYCVVCDRDRDVETLGNDPACEHHVSYCRGCDFHWPCPTVRALDGTP